MEKKFNITENDIIDIDSYILDRNEIKKKITEIKKIEEYMLVHMLRSTLNPMIQCYIKYRRCCLSKEGVKNKWKTS